MLFITRKIKPSQMLISASDFGLCLPSARTPYSARADRPSTCVSCRTSGPLSLRLALLARSTRHQKLRRNEHKSGCNLMHFCYPLTEAACTFFPLSERVRRNSASFRAGM